MLDDQDRELGRAADDHQRVASEAFAGDGESAARQRVVDPFSQRALADDGELRGRRQRAADKRAEREDERCFGGQWVGVRGAFVQEQPHAEAASAKELPKRRLIERHALNAAVSNVDAERSAPW